MTSIVNVELLTKPNGNDWLELTYPTGRCGPVAALVDDLALIGWHTADLLDLQGMSERTIVGPNGTLPFGVWTPQERRRHLNAVRRVLRRHGHTDISARTLRPHERD